MSASDPYEDEQREPLPWATSGFALHAQVRAGVNESLISRLVRERNSAQLEVAVLKEGLADANAARRLAEDRLADLQELLTESDATIVALAGGCLVLAIGVVLAWRR